MEKKTSKAQINRDAARIQKIEIRWLLSNTAFCNQTLLLRISYPYDPSAISAIGNVDILRQDKLALFCSVRCPGDITVKVVDIACALRDAGVTVISGFHSPLERKVLKILLKSSNSVIICPARSIEVMPVPREYEGPLADGRLLILSAFANHKNRATEETSALRNEFVASVTDEVFVIHAAPESKTQYLCDEIAAWKKPLYIFTNYRKD